MVHAQAATNLVNSCSSSSTVLPRLLRPVVSPLPFHSSPISRFTAHAFQHVASTRPGSSRGPLILTAALKKQDNPDLDEIKLDDAYYEEIGMTREEAIRQQQETFYSADPEAVALNDISSIDSSSLPEEWKERLAAIENLQVYGPPALVMAGFRAEEYAVARALLDSLGAHQVKVLPASQELLQSPVAVALAEAEVDWSSPRPPEWIMGGAWGSQRTILFSGLSLKTQATILELLEAQGLPQQICVTMALAEDQHRKLGEVMAAAVQAQRATKPPPTTAPWEIPKQATSSSSSSSSSSTTTSTSTTSSSSSKKNSFLSGLPGKRGPLFSRKSDAAAAAARSRKSTDDGLEPLQDLISPELARARLQVSGGDAGLADLIDLGIPYDESDTARLQQQQRLSSRSSSSSSSDQNADAQSQALLDWITDESTGEVVELPWTEDEQQTAAAVSRMAQQQQQQQQQGAVDEQPPISLDELLPQAAPPPAAAATSSISTSSSFWKQQQQQGYAPSRQTGSYSSSSSSNTQTSTPASAAAAAVGVDETGDVDLSGPSVFSTIQEALKSGVDPERLKQLIDQAAAAGAAAADPIDLLLQEDVAKAEAAAATAAALKAASKGAGSSTGTASSAGSSSSVSGPLSAAAAAGGTFGPAPPPAGGTTSSTSDEADDPMFKLRPEIERAFENNQIKFVDMTKLPSKYRKQYTLAAMQERQRAQQQQLQQQQEAEIAQQLAKLSDEERQQLLEDADQQQQQQRWWQQQQRSQQQQAMRDGLSTGVSGALPKGKIVEMDVEGGEEMQQGLGAGNNLVHDEDDDEATGEWDEAEEGAEALYLDESKLQQLVDSARQEGLDVSKTLAQALAYGVQIEPEVAAAVGVQLPSADVVAAAHAEIVGSIRELQQQEAAESEDEGEEIDVAATTVANSSSSSPVGSSQPRQWGSGLSAAVGRAKARLAQKKQQQRQ